MAIEHYQHVASQSAELARTSLKVKVKGQGQVLHVKWCKPRSSSNWQFYWHCRVLSLVGTSWHPETGGGRGVAANDW